MPVSPFRQPSITNRPALLLITAGCLMSGLRAENRSRLTLEEAYDRVLASDQTIAIALIESYKARLLPLSALTALAPQISARLGYDPSSSTTSGSEGNPSVATSRSGLIGVVPGNNRKVTTRTDLLRGGITWQQTLLDFTVFPTYRLGKLTDEAVRLQYQATVRDTLFGVARAYYEVLKEQAVVVVNEQTLALAEEQLDQAEKRFKVDPGKRTDTLRAKSTLENARRVLIESQAALALARNTLSNILNRGGQGDSDLVEPAAARFEDESFDTALAQAYARREDYQVSAIGIKQDIERRNQVKGEYGPRLVADLNQNWDAYNGSDRRVNNWSASLAVQIPIFTGGQREIDLRTSQYQIDQARLNYEKTGKAIQEELKAAWLLVRTLKETIKALHAEVEAAEQNYKDLQVQYQAGTATSLDVQAALRDLNNSRTILATQTYDYQVALRDLLRAQAAFQPLRVTKAADMLQSRAPGKPAK
jgi:outer membrane protein TolC